MIQLPTVPQAGLVFGNQRVHIKDKWASRLWRRIYQDEEHDMSQGCSYGDAVHEEDGSVIGEPSEGSVHYTEASGKIDSWDERRSTADDCSSDNPNSRDDEDEDRTAMDNRYRLNVSLQKSELVAGGTCMPVSNAPQSA